jgi:hypothetical protein
MQITPLSSSMPEPLPMTISQNLSLSRHLDVHNYGHDSNSIDSGGRVPEQVQVGKRWVKPAPTPG